MSSKAVHIYLWGVRQETTEEMQPEYSRFLPARRASWHAWNISSLRSLCSSASASPTFTNLSTAKLTAWPIRSMARQVLSDRLDTSRWLTSVVICEQETNFHQWLTQSHAVHDHSKPSSAMDEISWPLQINLSDTFSSYGMKLPTFAHRRQRDTHRWIFLKKLHYHVSAMHDYVAFTQLPKRYVRSVVQG